MSDLLVAGGGPVGLAVAVGGALAGLDVTVAEPRPLPRDKACGEGVMPTALAALRRLGVDPPGFDIRGIRYLDGAGDVQARFRHGPGRGVRRTALVAALEERADDLGVRRVARAVTAADVGPEGVEVDGVRAPVLAVADGLHSPLRRSLGLRAETTGPPRYGLRRHYRTAPWTDFVEVHWAADAEAYVTPVGANEVGVAVLSGGGAPYDVWLRRFPALERQLADAAGVGPVRGAGPLRQSSTRRVHGRALLVGDAAGYVDALTGEGLSVGLAAAECLVRCVAEGRLEDYEAQWRAATRRPRLLTASLLWAVRRPGLRRGLVPAAQRAPWLFQGAVQMLA